MIQNYPPGLQWLFPDECVPPHKVARHEQVRELALEFARNGWDPNQPALVGYYFEPEGKVQLLSGSHRWAAAMMSGLGKIPVLIRDYVEIWNTWGIDMDQWRSIMTPPRAGTPS